MKGRGDILALCVVWRAAIGWTVAAPWAIGAARAVGGRPGGDAVLWDDGGVMLLETARALRPAARVMAASSGALAVAAGLSWLLPLGMWIASLAPRKPRGWRAWLGRSAQALPPHVLLAGLLAVSTSLLVGGGAAIGAAAARSASVGTAAGALSGVALAGAVAWFLAVVADAARVPMVQDGATWIASMGEALRVLAVRPAAWLWAAGWRTALALLALAGAALLPGFLPPRSAPAATGVFAAQLAAVTAYVWLRAGWFRWLCAARRTALADLPPR